MSMRPLAPLCAFLALGGCVGDIASDGANPPADPGAGPGGGGNPTPGAPPPAGGDPTRPPGTGPPSPPGSPPPAAARPAPAAVPTTRFARLSHRQWENTVRDLLRLPEVPGLSGKFSSDSVDTFANNGEVLVVSESLRADYQTAAEALASRVARDPAALARLLPANAPAELKARAAAFIRDFGRRAYRRPLDAPEVAAYTALFDQGPALVPGLDPFAAGAQVVLEAMLQAPSFLYRTELGAGAGRQRLDDHEIAAKISYALAGTMPDDGLFAAAAAPGGLRSLDPVVAQAQRLLARGSEPGATFHHELFELGGLDLEKDPKRFPEYKPAWQDAIARESALFLGEIFASDRGLRELLTAPFTFVDATLAPLYGVKAPAGGGFARVELDPRQRAGFLTQISFLARYGASEPEPIRRGVFVNQTLLCVHLVPPEGATDDLPDPPASARTNRERVTAVTSGAACVGCHRTFINPAGFAFEHYDALGRHQTTENGVVIDAADTYNFASGPKSFKDAVEWSRVLADSLETHQCYARAWFTFLHGRAVQPADEPFVKWLADRSLRERASGKSLALTVVTDDSFLTRLP